MTTRALITCLAFALAACDDGPAGSIPDAVPADMASADMASADSGDAMLDAIPDGSADETPDGSADAMPDAMTDAASEAIDAGPRPDPAFTLDGTRLYFSSYDNPGETFEVSGPWNTNAPT